LSELVFSFKSFDPPSSSFSLSSGASVLPSTMFSVEGEGRKSLLLRLEGSVLAQLRASPFPLLVSLFPHNDPPLCSFENRIRDFDPRDLRLLFSKPSFFFITHPEGEPLGLNLRRVDSLAGCHSVTRLGPKPSWERRSPGSPYQGVLRPPLSSFLSALTCRRFSQVEFRAFRVSMMFLL